MKPNTRVHVLSFVGPRFENDWSQKGTTRRPRAGQSVPGPDWSIVEFDDTGGRLCVHRDSLMVANDQSRAA